MRSHQRFKHYKHRLLFFYHSFNVLCALQAVRHGHWVVLDELNLAPTEVLEALNRLLDDNRELFVPELQEVVKPHPEFMLFATQNPPGAYAGESPTPVDLTHLHGGLKSDL